MDLENKTNFFHSTVRPIAKFLIEHPKISGVVASGSYFAYEVFEAMFQNEPSDAKAMEMAGTGFAVYLGLKLFNEYALKKREVVLPEKDSGLLDKIKHFVFNNPSFFSLPPAAAFFLHRQYDFEGKFASPVWMDLVFAAGVYAMSHTVLNVHRANELFTRAYRNLESKDSLSKIFDFVLEHPVLSAGVTGTGLFYYWLDQFKLGVENDLSSAVSLSAFLSLPLAYGVYAVNTFTAGILHSSSRNLIKKNLSVFFNSMQGNYTKSIAAIEAMLTIPTSPDRKAAHHLNLSDIYTKKGELDYSLLHLKQALELSTEEKRVFNPFDWVRDLFKIDKVVDNVRNIVDTFKNNPIAKARQSIFYFRRNNYNCAIEKIEKARVLAPDEPAYGILNAMELDIIGKQEEAKLIWSDIVTKILQSSKNKFEQISNTSKEVLQIVSDALLADVFIFSRSKERSTLKNEHEISRFVYDSFPDKKRIPTPLAFLDQSDFAYFINSRLKGQTLGEHKSNVDTLLPILDLYFQLVANLTSAQHQLVYYDAKVPKLNYGEVLADKFISRIPADAPIKIRLFNNSEPVVRYLFEQRKSIIHGNFHMNNVIAGENGYAILDFGDMCFGLDVLGIPQFMAGTDLNADSRVITYEDCFDLHPGARSKKEFLLDCAMSSVFIDAWNIGRSYHYKEGNPEIQRANLLLDLDYLLSENWISLDYKERLRMFRDDVQLIELN